MKLLSKYSTISALLVLLTFSVGSQAQTVDSGVKFGSWSETGPTFVLASGNYTLDLLAFSLGTGAPTLFGIANTLIPAEHFSVAIAGDGIASQAFTTVGGTFGWLTFGVVNPGDIKGFTASVNAVPAPVPLPSSVIMIGSALAAMVSIGRRGASRRVRA